MPRRGYISRSYGVTPFFSLIFHGSLGSITVLGRKGMTTRRSVIVKFWLVMRAKLQIGRLFASGFGDVLVKINK